MAAAAQTTLVWRIYELSIDGEPSGSWVAKTVDGLAERWTFVPPGGSLANRDTWTGRPASEPMSAPAPTRRRLYDPRLRAATIGDSAKPYC